MRGEGVRGCRFAHALAIPRAYPAHSLDSLYEPPAFRFALRGNDEVMRGNDARKSMNRLIGGLRAQRELGIIYFSWHVARVARWRACKYYANIAQIRTEGVADFA